MHNIIIPSRYLAPKWQAYVTPKDKSFKFSDGTEVTSLWSLKQALLGLPEDLVMHHISQGTNDIANWVEGAIEDIELANEMRKYTHRWGLIVALERQMMRTVELPHYLAKRWLRKSKYPFTFVSGEVVSSLEELREVLNTVSDETVSFHQERDPNDISVWVTDVVGDYELGEVLNEASSRIQMQRFVSDHVEMLHEAASED